MTSEGTHHPGQEPDEVSPGAGGPAPYGDRPAQQDNGYGAPDLGWAPPPPARPTPAAPAWAAHDNQPAAPAWGAAQVPQQAEANAPGSWNQGNGGQPWPGAAEQHGRPAGEPDQPAWAQAAPPVRGAAQVPQAAGAWPAQDSPGQPGWANDQQDPAQSGGWANGAPAQDPAQSGGWANGAPAQDDRPQQPDWAAQDDPARSGGWQQQNAWPPADQSSPAWAQSEPAAARGAAQVPVAPPAPPTWPSQDDAGHSGGWTTGSPQEPAQSGGWANGAPAQQPAPSDGWAEGAPAQDQAQAGGWANPQDQAQAGGWSPHQQDQGHSGGWAADGAPQHDRPQQPDWATQDDPARSGGWAANPHDDRPQQPQWASQGDGSGWDGGAEQPAAGRASAPAEQAQGEWPVRAAAGTASVPSPSDDRDGPGWSPTESSATPPVRATSSIPGEGVPPAWAPAGSLPQRNSADRESVPDVQPWAASEAWGRSDPAEQASFRSGDGREQPRGEEPPIYQPGPAPGISPANAIPLPRQEQRVPGASLAASPPADYAPPGQYAPVSGQPAQAEPSAREGGASAYEPEQHWGLGAPRHEEPQSSAAPVVPAPRTSPESAGRASVPAAGGEGGSISASASVPLASRVMPPTDQALRPGGTPAPQPRVYGRPARPEPAEEPSHDEGTPPPPRFGAAPENRFEQAPDNRFEQGPDQRFDQAPENRFDQGPDQRFDQGPDQRFDQGPDNRFGHGPEQDQDNRDRPATAAFAAAPVAPASPAAPPAFPTGMPTFVDAPASDRPVNGVRPHSGAERPAERFGAPAGGAASVNGSGFGPGPGDPGRGGAYPPAFPPPPQPSEPSWEQQGPSEQDQGRFDAFKPIAEPAADAPTPKIRNGRVLAAVLVAAVLILIIPLGLLQLLGKIGDDESAPAYEIGSCVKQAGTGVAEVDCSEEGAFTVVSRPDTKEKCADPAQPHVVLPGEGTNRVLCLKPAAG